MKADAWQQGLKPSYKFYVILSIAKSRIEQKPNQEPPPPPPQAEDLVNWIQSPVS